VTICARLGKFFQFIATKLERVSSIRCAASHLECGDLSPLSQGDLSPSSAARVSFRNGALPARASGGSHSFPNGLENLTATSRLRQSGDKSPHSENFLAARKRCRAPLATAVQKRRSQFVLRRQSEAATALSHASDAPNSLSEINA
jgi:hypothetical protein